MPVCDCEPLCQHTSIWHQITRLSTLLTSLYRFHAGVDHLRNSKYSGVSVRNLSENTRITLGVRSALPGDLFPSRSLNLSNLTLQIDCLQNNCVGCLACRIEFQVMPQVVWAWREAYERFRTQILELPWAAKG